MKSKSPNRFRPGLLHLTILASLALPGSSLAAAAPTAEGLTIPAETPAEKRPNVLVWMLDDVGFGQLASFGGLVETPNIDRVAKMGLRYIDYHTPPICSAARAAFLTGRNPHSVHMGGHALVPKPLPGYDARIPAAAGTIAEYLRQGGYQTFAVGKWDHLPASDQTGAGPYDRWPLRQGFDRYYGFISADTNNWSPLLVSDNAPIATPKTRNYHLTRDLADRAISLIQQTSARGTASPFFLYWATGTAHAPHHAPADWITRYRGKFDMGWDEARTQILRRQIALKLVPASTMLAPRPDGMPAWNSLSAGQKRLYAHQMEVFAAALSYADAQFGRILHTLEARGELNNTVIIITSDNGASAEGAYSGEYNEFNSYNGPIATDAENLRFLSKWGGRETYPLYSFGWAVAGNTPLRYYKQTAHEGGTRVPFIIAWPNGIQARGELRGQFVYATDVAQTILDITGVTAPAVANDVPQMPLEGQSFAPSLSDPRKIEAKRAQYVELAGNKGLWQDNWVIVTTHRVHPWDVADNRPPSEPWELYDLATDLSQARDVASRNPDRVAAMSREFESQAERYHVNPIGNVSDTWPYQVKAANDNFAEHHGVWRYSGSVDRIGVLSGPPILTRSFKLTIDLTADTDRATGVIFSIGGSTGGMAFYLDKGRPMFAIRSLDGSVATVPGLSVLSRGATALTLNLARLPQHTTNGQKFEVTISANGRVIANQIIKPKLPSIIGFEDFSLGQDGGSTVVPAYPADESFPGKLENVVFDFAVAHEAAR